MQAKSDSELLREYAAHGTEAAFSEVVARYTDLVYTAARRQIGSPDLARDIAQSVFTDLARKASRLIRQGDQTLSLAGWLYRGTRYAALKVLREERRRLTHETEAMKELDARPETAPDWSRIEPVLDQAMSHLDEQDREAVLLRFFKNQDFRSVGAILGISDDAAQKRVSRALEKLRACLARQGVTATSGVLATVLSTNAVQVAPTGLAAALASASLSLAAAKGGAAVTITGLLVMTKTKLGIIGAVMMAGAGGFWFVQHRSLEGMRVENQALQQRVAQLSQHQEGWSNEIAQAQRKALLDSSQLNELLRLRGEVGMLRRQQRELEQSMGTPPTRARGGARPPSSAMERPRTPAPFQVQLVVGEPEDDSEVITNQAANSFGETLHVKKTPLLDHTAVRSATVTTNPVSGAPEINIEFSQEGQEQFARITKENLNQRLAIVMDGRLYSAPVVRTEITGGKAQISGSFTEEEARALAAQINGSLGAK